MAMETIKEGSYGAQIQARRDGDFDVHFLYNMDGPTHSYSTGDVSDRRTYKTKKMAIKKARAWIEKHT